MYQNQLCFSKNTIQFSETQFDCQKHNSISETQFNFKNTIQFHDNNIHFIPHSLITQFNFQKHFSIFKSTIQFPKHNTISQPQYSFHIH